VSFSLDKIRHALIFGGNGGIGHAMACELLENNHLVTVHIHHRGRKSDDHLVKLKQKYSKRVKIYQSELFQTDLLAFSKEIEGKEIKLDLLVNTIGFLHDEVTGPEKSLRDIDEDHFAKSFFINSTLTALMGKYFLPFFDRKEKGAFVTISAKIGSISDNRMGGWYSYRASKAALNMILKNMAIEVERKRSLTKVLSIHPGTTDTYLSKPFTKNTPYKLHTPIETAQNILEVIGSEHVKNGEFYSWDGTSIPW